MKIRKGFVSNSSSTSFCIYGICIDQEDAIKRLKENTTDKMKQVIVDENNKKKYVPKVDNFEELLDNDPIDVLYVIEHIDSLRIYVPYEEDIYIGSPYSSIGDDETGKEFEERVENLIKSLFGEDIKGFGLCEEAWRDG